MVSWRGSIPRTGANKTKMDEKANIVIETTCRFCGVSPALVLSETRSRPVVIARQYVHYFLRTILELRVVDVAFLTNRSYQDVLHSVSAVKNSAEIDNYFAYQRRLLEKSINKNLKKYEKQQR